jgi:hypothetical protein
MVRPPALDEEAEQDESGQEELVQQQVWRHNESPLTMVKGWDLGRSAPHGVLSRGMQRCICATRASVNDWPREDILTQNQGIKQLCGRAA